MESTNASVPGRAPSETEVSENLEKIISKHDGRIIVSAFSSLITRLYSLIEIAKRTNRKIVLSGRSLEQAIEIARKKRYIHIEEKQIVKERDIKRYPDKELMILCTGSQGERFAALNRISLNEHKYIKLKKGDLIIPVSYTHLDVYKRQRQSYPFFLFSGIFCIFHTKFICLFVKLFSA